MSFTLRAVSFRRHVVLTFAAIAVAVAGLPSAARASTPATATISEGTPHVAWTGPLVVATAGGCGSANNASCDNFKLTVSPPSPAYGPYVVEIHLQPQGDWDLEAYDSASHFLKS